MKKITNSLLMIFAILFIGGLGYLASSGRLNNLISEDNTEKTIDDSTAEITELVRETTTEVITETTEITTELGKTEATTEVVCEDKNTEEALDEIGFEFKLADIPAYDGNPCIYVNNNKPTFSGDDKKKESFEEYSNLDSLGRCQVAFALIGREILPTEPRGKIGSVKPSGWHTVKYSDVIEDNYLYNRCHLIAYELAGENANEKNLITGTRYLNIDGMLPFENRVRDYVDSTGNHVLYRVTPIYDGDNLVANGVWMEAFSVEDNGKGISYNVFLYNVQPGINIDYATGESSVDEKYLAEKRKTETTTEVAVEPTTEATTLEETTKATTEETTTELPTTESNLVTYILNTNTKKFHYTYCRSVNEMKEKNKLEFTGTREEVINKGYVPCKRCNP